MAVAGEGRKGADADRRAQMTKKLVEQAGRKALLILRYVRNEEFMKKVIEQHLEAFKFTFRLARPFFRKRC